MLALDFQYLDSANKKTKALRELADCIRISSADPQDAIHCHEALVLLLVTVPATRLLTPSEASYARE